MQLFRRLFSQDRIESSSVEDPKTAFHTRVQPHSHLLIALSIALIGLLGFLIVLLIAVAAG